MYLVSYCLDLESRSLSIFHDPRSEMWYWQRIFQEHVPHVLTKVNKNLKLLLLSQSTSRSVKIHLWYKFFYVFTHCPVFQRGTTWFCTVPCTQYIISTVVLVSFLVFPQSGSPLALHPYFWFLGAAFPLYSIGMEHLYVYILGLDTSYICPAPPEFLLMWTQLYRCHSHVDFSYSHRTRELFGSDLHIQRSYIWNVAINVSYKAY